MDTNTAEKTILHPTMAEVATFLNDLPFGVVSSIGPEGQPQAANVGFSQNDKLELMIGTDEHSRKALNMGRDNRVAFVATNFDRSCTFQMEGHARKISLEEFEPWAEAHFAKLPGSAPFHKMKGQVYFLITPTWARFSDCNIHPWATTEFEF